jgi:hypothetical protein
MRILVGKWSIDLLKKLSNLCIGTCLLEPNVATPLALAVIQQIINSIFHSIYRCVDMYTIPLSFSLFC